MKQLEYDASRAFEQYNEVDPTIALLSCRSDKPLIIKGLIAASKAPEKYKQVLMRGLVTHVI